MPPGSTSAEPEEQPLCAAPPSPAAPRTSTDQSGSGSRPAFAERLTLTASTTAPSASHVVTSIGRVFPIGRAASFTSLVATVCLVVLIDSDPPPGAVRAFLLVLLGVPVFSLWRDGVTGSKTLAG